MTVAIYCRVSTSDQNCATQLAELRQYAKARGWEVAQEHEYIDIAWSGAKASRPALNRLLQAATERKVDCILSYKLDRLGRSLINLFNLMEQLRSAGVRLIVTSQGFDTDQSNPTSMLLFSILGAVAEFERSLIRERVAAGMKRARSTGTRSGKEIGRPRLIMDRQKVWDDRDAGLSIGKLQAKHGLARGTVQRILEARKA